MSVKDLIKKLEEARTPSKFYKAAKALVDAAQDFLDNNTYESRDASGIEVDVKVYGRIDSFETALEKLAEKKNLSEDEIEYITDELGEEWANRSYEGFLEFERENIMLYLEDFKDVINEKEVGFAGRSGGHLILGDDKYYRDAIENIEYYLNNNFSDKGIFEGDSFSDFMDEADGDYDEIISGSEKLEELDTYQKAIDKIKDAVKGIPEMWRDELDYRLNEWYDNYFDKEDLKRFVEKRDYEENKRIEDARQAENNPPFPKDKLLYIRTSNNEYYVNYLGHIVQKKYFGEGFSGKWKFISIVRVDEETGEDIPFLNFRQLTPKEISEDRLYEKNDYRVHDNDYGTHRIWGDKIISMSLIDYPETKKDGGKVETKKDTSLFGVFMEKRFGWVTPNDSYYHGWRNRFDKGIQNVWNEADDETRQALIDAIVEKASTVNYFREEKLDYPDASLPIAHLFVKNRFHVDLDDSYAKNWISRFEGDVEKSLGYMDTRSLGIIVSVLKLKLGN